MIALILFLLFALLIFTFFYLNHRKKLENEFAEQIHGIQKIIQQYFSERERIKAHLVAELEENAFVEKWEPLFSGMKRFRNLKTFNDYAELLRFIEDFKKIHERISDSNAEIKRKDSIQKFLPRVEQFFNEIKKLKEQYITHLDEIRFSQRWQGIWKDAEQIGFRTTDKEFEKVVSLKSICVSFHDFIQAENEHFFEREFQKCDAFFSNIDGKSLDAQQRTAVVSDEDRILVLAGAGSGKTLTISAKVKYLCEMKGVAPSEILLISFTRKSAQEMTDRIQKKLGIQIEAKTFHKLGLDIIKAADGAHPEIAEASELEQFIHNFFEKELNNHPELIKNLTEYFAYYLDVPEDLEKYSSLGEYYEMEKNADLETIKSKYEQQRYIQESGKDKARTLTTLNNERVKSIEETKIANFLFLNGVKYEYEKEYPFKSDDSLRKEYRPDFYLSDYDIYLEHFGITKSHKVPWLTPVEEKKYLDDMRWKRSFHEKNKTKLIETYSYYNSEGILLEKLKELLLQNKVELKPRNFVDVFNTVYSSKSNKYLPEFIKLCGTFITLFKSNNYKIADIETLRAQNTFKEKKQFLQNRTNQFLDIIQVLLSEYQDFLAANHKIDFSDMINNAADKIRLGCDVPKYNHIIVDEYQDISKSRFNLLKSLAVRTGAKVFCVGDDWQSIYRFAGSDVSLFTDFQKYFGYTDVLKIEKTYRNSQQLIDEASRFILKKTFQLKKNLRSDKTINYPLVFLGYDSSPVQALNNAIKKIVSEFGAGSSILLLGRTNYDKEILKESGLFSFSNSNKKENLTLNSIPELKIKFLSVHQSKGLEADNVILLNFKNDKLGFPNQIQDDKILNLVLTNAEQYRFAEERRLFYVAITRTRNKIFILTDNSKPSLFFKEFPASQNICYASIRKRAESNTYCPRCKTGTLLKVEHNGKSFVGCSNFPQCRYTFRDTTVLINPKVCPVCGGFLVKRKGKGHWFIGCSNYPNCNHTEQIQK